MKPSLTSNFLLDLTKNLPLPELFPLFPVFPDCARSVSISASDSHPTVGVWAGIQHSAALQLQPSIPHIQLNKILQREFIFQTWSCISHAPEVSWSPLIQKSPFACDSPSFWLFAQTVQNNRECQMYFAEYNSLNIHKVKCDFITTDFDSCSLT